MNASSFPLATQAEVPSTHWDGDLATDIFAPCGTPWLAVFDGYAEPRDYALGGYTVMLTAPDGTQAYYAHGESTRASGQVSAGDVIGYVSNSGNAIESGCHLHFAVGQINYNGGGTIAPAIWLSGTTPEPGPEPGPQPGPISPVAASGAVAVILLIALVFLID